MEECMPLKSYIFAAAYILISIFTGEWHPFTRVPMYSSFPNYGYAFYLADSTGQPAFFHKYDSGFISHVYVSIAQNLHIKNGFQMETRDELTQIGKGMLEEMLRSDKNKFPKGVITLHRVAFAFEGDTIAKHDVILYSTINE